MDLDIDEVVEERVQDRDHLVALIERVAATVVDAGITARLEGLGVAVHGDRVGVAPARCELRRLVAAAGAAAVADHAQSPLIDGADAWDYQRDRHRDGFAWEQAWMAEMLPASRASHRAVLTSCGMAAVTTVLAHVERRLGGPILVDDAVYHETRHLLATGGSRSRVRWVSIGAVDAVAALAGRVGAAALVVDAVANAPSLRVPDLPALVRALGALPRPPLVVVDTSVCTMTAPHVRALLTPGTVPVVLVESLTKHAQLGLDRIPAGVIVARHDVADECDRLREHLGTNITDIAARLLLPPHRGHLQHRLERIGRNAALLASRLGMVTAVAHPSRPGHPDHRTWAVHRPSCGLLAIDRADAGCIDRWLALARARDVELHHGAGFGFDTTRVYRPVATVPEATTFVRVAPGTEDLAAASAIADVLVDAIADGMAAPRRARRR